MEDSRTAFASMPKPALGKENDRTELYMSRFVDEDGDLVEITSVDLINCVGKNWYGEDGFTQVTDSHPELIHILTRMFIFERMLDDQPDESAREVV